MLKVPNDAFDSRADIRHPVRREGLIAVPQTAQRLSQGARAPVADGD